MAIYTKDYLRRALQEYNASVKHTMQVVLQWVTPLAATMLSLLCPVCYAVELSTHGRILICGASLLLLLCLLVAIRANLYLVRMGEESIGSVSDFLKHYEEYNLLYDEKEQMRLLQGGDIMKTIKYARIALKLFAAALLLLFSVLLQILFA